MHALPRILACATLLLSAHLVTAAAAGPQPLAPGVRWLPGEFVPGRQPDGNSVLFEAPDGMVVFDTGRSPAHAARLLQALKDGGRPLVLIVNSHWHLDHIGGNAPLKAAYPAARVMASDAITEARTGFLARYHQQIDERLAALPQDATERAALEHELEIIDGHAASSPDIVVRATGERPLAGRPFLVGLAAHAATAGDVWLYSPQSRVLASGDLVTLPAPLLDTACPAQWQAALDRLAEVDFEWLVPGHGAPMQRAGFETYRRAYRGLLQCAASDADARQCVDGWLHDAGTLVPPQDEPLARGLLGYYLDQVLRRPEALRRAGCPAA
jgi:glyoxylase-like metal-dependent hydrolase (beta-lactamase superfamily II)